MSGSNWLKHPKARLVGGLAIVVTFGSIVLAYGHSESSEYKREANAYSREYASYTRQKVAQACVGISRVEAVRCVYDAHDAKAEYSYNQRDLVAQRQSALWSYIMAFAAVIGMVLSAVGVWLVWGTYRQTAEAAESARKTLSSYIWKERAHIRIKDATVTKSSALNEADAIVIDLENVGLSAAHISRVCYQVVDGLGWRPTTMTEHFKRILVPADGSEETGALNIGKIRESSLNGFVEYTTLKDQTFRSYFCFIIRFIEDDGYTSARWVTGAFYPAGMTQDT